jgi:hypothetical protein
VTERPTKFDAKRICSGYEQWESTDFANGASMSSDGVDHQERSASAATGRRKSGLNALFSLLETKISREVDEQ